VDVTQSTVQDPAAWENVKVQPQTAWRVDRMKNMTYTQFWQLVKERRVDKVSTRQHGTQSQTARTIPTITAFNTCFHDDIGGRYSAVSNHTALCDAAGEVHIRQALCDGDHKREGARGSAHGESGTAL
jgi:hypothetical protein